MQNFGDNVERCQHNVTVPTKMDLVFKTHGQVTDPCLVSNFRDTLILPTISPILRKGCIILFGRTVESRRYNFTLICLSVYWVLARILCFPFVLLFVYVQKDGSKISNGASAAGEEKKARKKT